MSRGTLGICIAFAAFIPIAWGCLYWPKAPQTDIAIFLAAVLWATGAYICARDVHAQ